MYYPFNREENENAIRMLAERYPKCFFVEPQQRRPLKKNIVADLQKDGCPTASELIASAVEWYKSHFAYHYHVQAGVKRVGLNGEDDGTVTELEARNAQKYVNRWSGVQISHPAPPYPCQDYVNHFNSLCPEALGPIGTDRRYSLVSLHARDEVPLKAPTGTLATCTPSTKNPANFMKDLFGVTMQATIGRSA
jgi:hypothetical protein